MRPTKISAALMILGLSGILVGIAFKLNHLMGAETVFNGGVVALVVGLLAWGLTIVRGSGS
jgi:NADH:ubiquinone oxidoreductase subunit K